MVQERERIIAMSLSRLEELAPRAQVEALVLA